MLITFLKGEKMENEALKSFDPKSLADELLKLIVPAPPTRAEMENYDAYEYCLGCADAISNFIETPIVTLFEPIDVKQIDLFIGLNSHHDNEDSRLSIETLNKKRKVIIKIQSLAQERFTNGLKLPNLKWLDEHKDIKERSWSEFENLVWDTFGDYEIYCERIKATFVAMCNVLEVTYDKYYDEYEKERIEEDQAECEQIEAEMEAEVEAKYEDFLDAQKYDPSLRA